MTDTATPDTVTIDTGKADALKNEGKSFLAQAQDTIETAVTTAVNAVRDNPGTAAAIAGGVAAAAAGTALGVTKLRSGGKPATAAKSSKKS